MQRTDAFILITGISLDLMAIIYRIIFLGETCHLQSCDSQIKMLKLLQMDLKNLFQISFIHSGAVHHVCFKIDSFEFKPVLSLLHDFFCD